MRSRNTGNQQQDTVCPSCHGRNGSHQKIPKSEPEYNAKGKRVGVKTSWERCPRG